MPSYRSRELQRRPVAQSTMRTNAIVIAPPSFGTSATVRAPASLERPTASSRRPVTGRRLSCRRREGEAAGWSQLPARPITQADLAALTEKVRRRVVRWFRMQRLLDADAAADMVARENSGFSVNASVRITLFRLQLSRGVRPESQAQVRRHGARHREGTGSCSAGTGACPRLQGKRDRHRLLRSRSQSLPRHLPAPKAKLMARVGEEFPVACPWVWWRHPALSVDRKLRGTSTIGPHPARPALRLLLMIRPARPSPAEVPLADLSLMRDGGPLPEGYMLRANP